MTHLRLVDGRGERKDSLGGITVYSSGGIPPSWSALIEHLPRWGRILDYGSWQGSAALWLRAAAPDAKVSFAHYSSTKVAQAQDNATASRLELDIQPVFPLVGNWDTIVLAAPEQRESLVMFAGQAAACLSPDGQLLVVEKHPRLEELSKFFSSVVECGAGDNWSIVQCSVPKDQNRDLPWRKLHIQIRGSDFVLNSLPGNFSPDGLDLGTRAMLEEALIPHGCRVLDLACGYGVVGIAAIRLGAGRVVFVDDDLVALEATHHNLHGLGLDGELLHSHLPDSVLGKFDIILTNPPYHTDYGVARSFLEFAARRLTVHGWLYVVVKKSDWYVNKIRSLFGGCQVVERDGYSIISAQQRLQKAEKSTKIKTTRKHKRRQQAREKNRHG